MTAGGSQSRGVTEPQRDLGENFFQNCLQFGFPPGVPLVPLADKQQFNLSHASGNFRFGSCACPKTSISLISMA